MASGWDAARETGSEVFTISMAGGGGEVDEEKMSEGECLGAGEGAARWRERGDCEGGEGGGDSEARGVIGKTESKFRFSKTSRNLDR